MMMMSQKSNGDQIENAQPPPPPLPSVTNTTTFIELNKDTCTSNEAPVVINVKVENDEYIIDTIMEEDEEDDDHDGDQPDEEEHDSDPTYDINEPPLSDLMHDDDHDDDTDGVAQNDIIQPSSAISMEEKRRALSHQKIAKKTTFEGSGRQKW